jgi:hypothetical protein
VAARLPTASQNEFVVVSKNTTLCVTFKDPQFAKDHKFSAARLAGAIEPTATLKPGDFNHNRQSFNRGGMYRGSGGGGYARGGSSRGGGGGGNAGGYNNGNSPKDTWTPNHNFGMGERDDRRAAFSQSAHRYGSHEALVFTRFWCLQTNELQSTTRCEIW